MDANGPFSGWDWGAAAVILVIAVGAFRSIVRAFTAPDALDARFTDRQRQARAGLEADHIIPALADLLTKASARIPGWALSQTSEDELTNLLQDELNSADYLENLRELGRLARDHDRIASNYIGAESSARVRGFAGVVTLAGLSYPGFWVVSTQEETNIWLWLSVVAALVAAAVMIAAWVNETRLRISLVRLCRNYERA